MLGCAAPTSAYAPQRPDGGAAERYARSEFRDGGAAWLMAEAARAEAREPQRHGSVERWFAWASAAASKLAHVFL